jgi:hypothetical protein
MTVPGVRNVAVDVRELRDAFEFVSTGEAFDAAAYISLDTGRIHWRSDAAGIEEELPPDIDDPDRYLAVPTRRELNLGRRLALAFVAEELPDDFDAADRLFRRRGAYGHFKGLLGARGKLDRWYEFEMRAIDAALHAWCDAHGVAPVGEAPAS